jgi:hypothetical protein
MQSSSCEGREDIVWSRLPTAQLTLEVSSLSSAFVCTALFVTHYVTDIVLAALATCRQSRRPAEGGQ